MRTDYEKMREEIEAAKDQYKTHPNATKWTPEIDQILIDNWKLMHKDKLAEIIGVNYSTCLKRAKELGVV